MIAVQRDIDWTWTSTPFRARMTPARNAPCHSNAYSHTSPSRRPEGLLAVQPFLASHAHRITEKQMPQCCAARAYLSVADFSSVRHCVWSHRTCCPRRCAASRPWQELARRPPGWIMSTTAGRLPRKPWPYARPRSLRRITFQDSGGRVARRTSFSSVVEPTVAGITVHGRSLVLVAFGSGWVRTMCSAGS